MWHRTLQRCNKVGSIFLNVKPDKRLWWISQQSAWSFWGWAFCVGCVLSFFLGNWLPVNVSFQEPSYAADTEELIVIYNRVPKTGSTSFAGIAYELCLKNKFHVLHINVTKNNHVLSVPDQVGKCLALAVTQTVCLLCCFWKMRDLFIWSFLHFRWDLWTTLLTGKRRSRHFTTDIWPI